MLLLATAAIAPRFSVVGEDCCLFLRLPAAFTRMVAGRVYLVPVYAMMALVSPGTRPLRVIYLALTQWLVPYVPWLKKTYFGTRYIVEHFSFFFSFFSYFFPASRYVYLLRVPSSVQQPSATLSKCVFYSTCSSCLCHLYHAPSPKYFV